MADQNVESLAMTEFKESVRSNLPQKLETAAINIKQTYDTLCSLLKPKSEIVNAAVIQAACLLNSSDLEDYMQLYSRLSTLNLYLRSSPLIQVRSDHETAALIIGAAHLYNSSVFSQGWESFNS